MRRKPFMPKQPIHRYRIGWIPSTTLRRAYRVSRGRKLEGHGACFANSTSCLGDPKTWWRIPMNTLRAAPGDFEREIAALRHMEKLRAEMRDGVKVICLW